jgi:hypothetical protein
MHALNSGSLNNRAHQSMSGMGQTSFEVAFDVVRAHPESAVSVIRIWVQ